MNSSWNDDDARRCIDRYGPEHGEDLALRVYTSRLIGREPRLVLHGGGNTSVKTTVRSVHGEPLEVVHVKGSGHDLATIEPAGLPAVEYGPLRRLRELERLDDREMVNQVRIRMLDADAPNPSVETLLHAFLPHKFVDHTHADFVLELTNQPEGAAVAEQALGDEVVVLPWTMPGFPLAVAVAEAHERRPECQGIAVCQHGLFTFGEDARTSYERMIALVDRARRYVDRAIGKRRTMLAVPARQESAEWVAALLPVVRGAVATEVEGKLGRTWRRVVADWRRAPDVVAFSAHGDARDLVGRGPLTPDHVIRTQRRYLFLTREQAGSADACREAVQAFAADQARYYEQHRGRRPSCPPMRDPAPRVVVLEGGGVVAFGEDKRAASIAGDIAEQTVRSMARAAALGSYRPLPAEGVFDIEYWPLELAKLGAADAALLRGQVALVTGAGGAIGHGIAEALLDAGCHVVLTDVSAERLEAVRAELASHHPAERVRASTADVTLEAEVAQVFDVCRTEFGGVDVVVPNAGIAHVSTIAELDPDDLRRVLDVNVTGTMNVLKHAAGLFARQRTGGSVVVQSSKNVFDPGAGFGAYSASKAGVHQLGKIAALELAPLGVRVNMVNADAVFGDGDIKSGLWEHIGPDRMRSRGLDPEGLRSYYRERSLLKTSVLPYHVGQAVVFFAAGLTPTTGATLPVDAGVPGAFPR